MLASLSKLILCAAAFTLSASPQSSGQATSQKTTDICTAASPLSFDISFYQAQTRSSLEKLGANNHPVGLYWLAEADLRRDDKDAAILKLKHAARQGLADAYFRLAEIYISEKDNTQAKHARLCGQALEAKTSEL
ncbi:MAG: hypothetical protein ABJN69_13180 [Hellea sp.]